ncbi:hypothetical protein PM082_010312 [Marasmius tenuissimus]|nr:hypothetical protein PM082_010312 [Marasmius tenuissimus]
MRGAFVDAEAAAEVALATAEEVDDGWVKEKRERGVDFAVTEEAATAVAQVSAALGALAAGEESWAMRRGYLNFTETTWDTRDENNPAENRVEREPVVDGC